MGTPIWAIEGVALDSTGDLVAGSLGDVVNDINLELSAETLVYPNLTDGVDVVSANADWTLGAYATIVAAGVITDDFHITAIQVENCNQNAVFQLELYSGAGDDLIATLRFSVAGGFFGNMTYRTGAEVTTASSQIRARLASSDGLANQATVAVSIRYHVH
jgi:hypothetical protein